MADNVGYCSLEACVIATYGIDDHDEKTSLLTELARLRAADDVKRNIIDIVRESREKHKWPISDAHFAGVVGHTVLLYMDSKGFGDPFYMK